MTSGKAGSLTVSSQRGLEHHEPPEEAGYSGQQCGRGILSRVMKAYLCPSNITDAPSVTCHDSPSHCDPLSHPWRRCHATIVGTVKLCESPRQSRGFTSIVAATPAANQSHTFTIVNPDGQKAVANFA